MSRRVKKVLCVQHRQGWCALKPGEVLDESATLDATACGWFVTFRWGEEVRVPTCPDCLKALKGVEDARGPARV